MMRYDAVGRSEEGEIDREKRQKTKFERDQLSEGRHHPHISHLSLKQNQLLPPKQKRHCERCLIIINRVASHLTDENASDKMSPAVTGRQHHLSAY